jgi:TetR/AcrR family transcriptional regulator, transcriptional repressor for nem operon
MSDTKTIRKDRSHGRILESAGNLMRERGISGASVANVMDGAGMTVGGFYAHFPSKQALVQEALRETIGKSRVALMAAAEGKKGKEWVRAITRSYLSRQHRDNPNSGCPLPAVLGEAARENLPVREALAREIESTADEIASHLEAEGYSNPRGEALALLSTMIGGLTLSRALPDVKLSDAVLLACRRQIEKSLS